MKIKVSFRVDRTFLFVEVLVLIQNFGEQVLFGICNAGPPSRSTRQLDTTCCTLNYSYENNERCNEEPERFSTE
jgi:hypothetical protein